MSRDMAVQRWVKMVGAWDTGSHSSKKRPVSRFVEAGKREVLATVGRDDVPGSAMAGSPWWGDAR